MVRKVTLYVVLLLCLSCRSVEKTTSSSAELKESYKSSVTERISGTIETFGDTLAGIVPLRPLTKIPQLIPVRSNGIELELSLTDTSISYKAIARPVARSTLSWESETVTEAVKEVKLESSKHIEKKGIQLRWWVYAVFIICMLTVVVIVIINYNPFKKL